MAMIVGFGIEDGTAFEVHTYYTPAFLITLRRDASTTFDTMHRTGSVRPFLGGDPIRLLHQVISLLHGQARAVIDEMDDRLDHLESQVLARPDRRAADRDRLRQATGHAPATNPHARPRHRGTGSDRP